MHGTALILLTVGCALVVLALALSMVLRVRRVVRSGRTVPVTLKMQAGVMGFAVVLLVVLIGLSALGS